MNKLTYTVFTSFMGNTFLSIVKIIAGFVGRSMSLIVDGVHTFADQSLELVTMSNTRFLKSIFTRQRKTEKFFSKIFDNFII